MRDIRIVQAGFRTSHARPLHDRGMRQPFLIAPLVLLALLSPALAAAADDEVMIWPTVRYGWPERLSAGVAVQPRLGGLWDRLVLTGTAGTGGLKAGVGLGGFGGDCMVGRAIHATVTRTTANPRGAEPHQTFLGAEAEVMAANFSIKVGPAFALGPRRAGSDRFRLNVSFGFGF